MLRAGSERARKTVSQPSFGEPLAKFSNFSAWASIKFLRFSIRSSFGQIFELLGLDPEKAFVAGGIHYSDVDIGQFSGYRWDLKIDR